MMSLPADAPASPAAHRCARCGFEVKRIPRVWSDRLWPPALATRRYRCLSVWCGWQGCLPLHQAGPGAHPAAPR